MDETMEIMQKTFQIEQRDDMATALEELVPGTLRFLGDGCIGEAEAVQKVPRSHRIAPQNIGAGKDVIGYGMHIARASKDIRTEEWVHLHSIRSVYDERSSHLDVMTEASKDTRYK